MRGSYRHEELCAVSCIAAWFEKINKEITFGCETVSSQSNQMAATTAIQSTLSAPHHPPTPLWSTLADTITAYVAANPATSATPGPEGLEMSNTFKLL